MWWFLIHSQRLKLSIDIDLMVQDKANLMRIRDNQRRSRARRKEYMHELEQRLRVYELQGIEASSEIQQAARKVVDENKKLRSLLNKHGITDSSIDSFLQDPETNGSSIPHSHGSTEDGASNVLETLLAPRTPRAHSNPLTMIPKPVGPTRRSHSLGSIDLDGFEGSSILDPRETPLRSSTSGQSYELVSSVDQPLYRHPLMDLQQNCGQEFEQISMAPGILNHAAEDRLVKESQSHAPELWTTSSQIASITNYNLQTSSIMQNQPYYNDPSPFTKHPSASFSTHCMLQLSSSPTETVPSAVELTMHRHT